MTKANGAKAAREQAEAAVKDHLQAIAKCKADLAEAQQKSADATRDANALADERENLMATGDTAKADDLRVQVATLMGTVNVETTRARGLQRRLDALDSETRPLIVAALKAWLPELVADERQALARLDDQRVSIEVPDVEEYVAKARARYSAHHDIASLGCHDLGQASWAARFELEKRGIPLPPSMMVNAVRDRVASPWDWLLREFTQAVPA